MSVLYNKDDHRWVGTLPQVRDTPLVQRSHNAMLSKVVQTCVHMKLYIHIYIRRKNATKFGQIPARINARARNACECGEPCTQVGQRGILRYIHGTKKVPPSHVHLTMIRLASLVVCTKPEIAERVVPTPIMCQDVYKCLAKFENGYWA